MTDKHSTKTHKHVIFLTRDLIKPKLSKEVIFGIEDSLWWLSWYELSGILDEEGPKEILTRDITSDLKHYLENKGLHLFQGFAKLESLSVERFFWNDTIPLITPCDTVMNVSTFFWKGEKHDSR